MSAIHLPAIRCIALSVFAHLLIVCIVLLLKPLRQKLPVQPRPLNNSIMHVTTFSAADIEPSHPSSQANDTASTRDRQTPPPRTISSAAASQQPVRQANKQLNNDGNKPAPSQSDFNNDVAADKITSQTEPTQAHVARTPSRPVQQPRLDTARILANAASRVQERPLSSSELVTLSQSLESRAQSSDVTQSRRDNLTATRFDASAHPDVLTRFDDGKQLVKIGKDSCAIAEVGADLRKNIHSIRNVPCPDAHSDVALFERIMAEIGQH